MASSIAPVVTFEPDVQLGIDVVRCTLCGWGTAKGDVEGQRFHKETCQRVVSAQLELKQKEAVNHPSHYGGKDNPYEAIKVIEAWELDFHLGNAVKYISRAGKKDPNKTVEDLEKAAFYLQRKIDKLKQPA